MVADLSDPSKPQIASTEYLVFRTSESSLARYLMWYLQSPRFRDWITLSVEGATGSHTRAKSGPILRQAIPLPPLAEQRRIVATIEEHFSRLDAAEESLRRADRMLEVMRRSIYSQATRGFDTVDFGLLATDLRYGTSTKCSYESNGKAVLRIPNIKDGRIDLSDLKHAVDTRIDLSAYDLSAGDLLFVRTNGSRDLIGRVGLVDGSKDFGFASYLVRARPHRDRLDSRYAVIALASPELRAVIESRAATTAGQYNLNLAALRSLPVPLPLLPDQRRIVAEVERQLSLVDALAATTAAALKRSEALRRSILERAFSGKLVPQDPFDEPASVLLKRIRAERANTPPPKRRRSARR